MYRSKEQEDENERLAALYEQALSTLISSDPADSKTIKTLTHKLAKLSVAIRKNLQLDN